MKIYKKIVSILLVVSMIISTSISALAVENEIPKQEDQMEYNKFTISFALPEERLAENSTQSEISNYERTIVATHNANAAEQAKDFVLSLNLPAFNLDFIESSCLRELNEITNSTDFILTSYTVRVPKGAMQSRSVPFDDLTYYGSYGGRDFYFYYYSETKGTTQYKKTSKRMIDWFSNIVDLVLCFASAEFTVPLTIVRQQTGYDYTLNNEAYAEYFFDVNIESRGIYALYNNSRYEEVTSGQIGHLYPYIVYYPLQRPEMPGSISIDFGYQGPVYTTNFSNRDVQLKNAWMAYNGSIGNWHLKVMDYKSSYYWG